MFILELSSYVLEITNNAHITPGQNIWLAVQHFVKGVLQADWFILKKHLEGNFEH